MVVAVLDFEAPCMLMSKRGPIFRVTGLPASQPDDELERALKDCIDNNLVDEEEVKRNVVTAIVPSCYDDKEKVALVEFRDEVPKFLSELEANPLAMYQDEMGDTDINFDKHFFGFTQLYTPKADAPVTADIIAITDLSGNAYGSWRGKGNLGRMWLRNFLCKDLPHCRTMIYGYNSKLSSHGIDTVLDYGRELIEELKKIRNTEELQKRPLFFIAHGFGGIILAHCLIKAVNADEHDHPTILCLHKATYGMLLFGVPHKGLILDDIQKMVSGESSHPRNALLQEIQSQSKLLANQLVDFKNLIGDRKIVSFYETGQTRRLQFDSESKSWKRTGDFITEVDPDSALLQLPDSMEEKIPLKTDHSMMVKFDARNEAGYTSARDRLRQFERDAPRVVANRFLRAQNSSKPSLLVPFARDSTFVGREDTVVQIAERNDPTASLRHSRVALVGLGGMGESQTSIKYVYRVREDASDMRVFWVHASNAARFEESCKDIAAKLELPDRDDAKINIPPLVHDSLCDERNGKWLVIVDNADDEQVFSSFRANVGSGIEPDAELAKELEPLASRLP